MRIVQACSDRVGDEVVNYKALLMKLNGRLAHKRPPLVRAGEDG